MLQFWLLTVFDDLFRVISTLTAGLVGFGTTLYTLIFLYFFFANAFFLVSGLYLRLTPDLLTVSNTAAITEVGGSPRQCSSERWDCKPGTEESAHNVPVLHCHDTDIVHVDSSPSLIRYTLGFHCFCHAKKKHTRSSDGDTTSQKA